MQGTAYNRNVLHRLGDALQAFSKGLPSPAQMFTPQQQNVQTGYISFPGWPVLEKQAQDKDEQRAKTAVTSPWVFADISAIANEFSASELIVKERTGDGLEDVEDHPLELLWEAPNPHMGRSYLMKYWAWSYTLVGKAYLYWLPTSDGIKELWPVPPFMIRPVPGKENFIDGYMFKAAPGAQAVVIPAEYITYSHSVNLFDIRDGLSFLVAAMTGIESDLAMERWNRNFFDEQNGVPDGLITVNKDTLDTDLLRIRSELRDFFGGTRRGVAVARTGDMDYKPFGRSQKEVEFKEGIELASKIIGRTLGFPDGYWSETANRANAEQARATMIAGAVWPLLVQLHEDMNAGPVKRFWGDTFRAEFKDIRPEDRALKLQELQFYAQIETVNELRKRIGADDLDDVRGLMLVAEIGKGAPLPATPAAEETEAYLAEQEASVAEEAPVEEEVVEGEPVAPIEGEEFVEEEAVIPEEAPMKAADKGFSLVLQPSEMITLHTVPLEQPSLASDLRRWEAKALRDIERKGRVYRPFESEAIPEEEQARIKVLLDGATTVEAVKAAFVKATPDDTDALISAEWSEAVKWARKVETE